MSYITAIGTANPAYRIKQSRIASFMVKAMRLNSPDERRLRSLFRSSGIDYRFSVIKDYGCENSHEFFPENENLEPFPSTEKRILSFREHALPLSLQAIKNALPDGEFNSITHLIVVCCTGMSAPGLDIDIIKALNLPTDTQRVCINFMGCYAAINALQTGDAFCKAKPSAKVLIVCTELCSLHFQKNPTIDNIISNALFSDGSAALLMEAQKPKTISLRPMKFHTDLFFEGENDMSWNIGDFGFEMKLSSYVPSLIEKGIRKLTDSLLKGISIELSSIQYFATHPGGKKILKAIEQELNITTEQNEYAHYVLRNYGNMSSPTVLFVLNEIFKSLSLKDDKKHVLSFAFGPGLTLGSLLLEINAE
jgi:predicted naringenin-chalcone synthase